MAEQDAIWFRETFNRIRTEVGKAVVGQDDIVEHVLIGMAANGHVLLEGMPGLGKTLLVRSLASVLSLDFSRIQFTPDMMPADVTGTNILSESRSFEFRKGPIFANIVLADEINRATPKTQSALLEAMQERSVTVGGKRHDLAEPFLVMATQNPVEQEGTYPLPEAQLDRFFFKLLVPYPTKEELRNVVLRTTGNDSATLQPVATSQDIIRMRTVSRDVPISEAVLDFALELALATHPDSPKASKSIQKYVRYGTSPRGAQCLCSAGKVMALLAGRFNVAKDDIKKAAVAVLRHRLILNYEAEADGVTPDQLVAEAIAHLESSDRDTIRV